MHECSICLENLFIEIPCALKCGHVFHYKCIKHQEDLLPVSDEGIRDYRGYHCPLCRTHINPWQGDIVLLNSLVDINISNIANLEYGMDLMANFEVKNITILNQRLKFYLADLQNVKREIEAGNKELDNLHTIKSKVYEEVQKTCEYFKKEMLKFAEKSKIEIRKLREEKEKLEKESKNFLKKMEKDEKEMREKMEKDEKKMKSDISEKMKKMKKSFERELNILSEKEMREVNKEKQKIEETVKKRTEEEIKEYIEKYKEEVKERKKISKKYDLLQKKVNKLIDLDELNHY
jgi:DNA repair exonuclease SbcCD ATPase subunit